MTNDSNLGDADDRPDQPEPLDQRANQRIEAALAQLGADYEPPVGWEARVLAATRSNERPRWLKFAVPALAVAAAAAIAIVVIPQPSGPVIASVEVETQVKVRGAGDGSVGVAGSIAHVTIRDGLTPRALWIYREDQGWLLCPRDPACPDLATGDFRFVLNQVGRYDIVVVTGRAAQIRPIGELDRDVATAQSIANRDGDSEIVERKLTIE